MPRILPLGTDTGSLLLESVVALFLFLLWGTALLLFAGQLWKASLHLIHVYKELQALAESLIE